MRKKIVISEERMIDLVFRQLTEAEGFDLKWDDIFDKDTQNNLELPKNSIDAEDSFKQSIGKDDGLELLKKNADLLKNKRKIDVSHPQFIATGTRGSAFELGSGKVLKVTTDKSEAVAMQKVKDSNLKVVVKVFDVFRFRDTSVYGIYQEELEPLDVDESQEVSGIFTTTMLAKLIKDNGYAWDRARNAAIELFRQQFNKIKDPGERADYEKQVRHYWNLMIKKYKINEMAKELQAKGIQFYDYHAGNIMKRKDGSYVLIDLGHSNVQGGREPDVLERLVREHLTILESSRTDAVGLTIMRAQGFHKGHGELIRQLTSKFDKVLVIIAGNRQDKKNPFSFETRVQMMKLSLPDVWGKLEIHKAEFGGKGSGYLPGILSDIIKNKDSVLEMDTAVNILVGADRFDEFKRQFDTVQSTREKGTEILFDPQMAHVEKLPDVSNDGDEAGRISGTRVREMVSKGDRKGLEQLLDPHLVSNPEDFEEMYVMMRKDMGLSESFDPGTTSILANRGSSTWSSGAKIASPSREEEDDVRGEDR